MIEPVLIRLCADFGRPRGAILGIMNSIYSLGALSMMVFVPWVNDRYGRKMSIIVGNVIMLVGAILQACSVNRESIPNPWSSSSPARDLRTYSQSGCFWRRGLSLEWGFRLLCPVIPAARH